MAGFKAMLLAADSFVRQQMLLQLLAAEEAKLVAREKHKTWRRREGPSRMDSPRAAA
jgi:hypothetical protein